VAQAAVFRMPHVRVVGRGQFLVDGGSDPARLEFVPDPDVSIEQKLHNELYLSPVSLWELVLLVEKKRINIAADFAEWINGSLEDLQMQEAPFSFAVAHELRFTQLPHRDSGDRFIVATARIHDMTI
jgi:PIN domain nuclease of toxin-antitoxin system